jgi:hypothetical protein
MEIPCRSLVSVIIHDFFGQGVIRAEWAPILTFSRCLWYGRKRDISSSSYRSRSDNKHHAEMSLTTDSLKTDWLSARRLSSLVREWTGMRRSNPWFSQVKPKHQTGRHILHYQASRKQRQGSRIEGYWYLAERVRSGLYRLIPRPRTFGWTRYAQTKLGSLSWSSEIWETTVDWS